MAVYRIEWKDGIEARLAKSYLRMAAQKSKGSGKKVEAQYRNPADNAQTWIGRGRQPKWIAEGLAASGKSLDDFRI